MKRLTGILAFLFCAIVQAAAPTFVSSGVTTFSSTGNGFKDTSAISVQTSDVIAAWGIASDNASFTLSDSATNSYTSRETIAVANYCAIRVDTASAAGSSSPTFRASKDTGGSSYWGGGVAIFRGSAGIGAAESTNVLSGAPSLAITTTQPNSALLVVVADWTAADGASRTWRTVNSITPTAGNGFELVYNRDASNATFYVAYYPDVGTPGAKTVGLSAPGGQKYSIAAIEITGTGGGGGGANLPAIVRHLRQMKQ